MAWELVFEALEKVGFERDYRPEDPDGSELRYQEGIFVFAIGESDIVREGLSVADVVRRMIQTLTNRKSQEEEFSQLFGTRVTIHMDGEPGWSPAPEERKGRPFVRKKGKPFARKSTEAPESPVKLPPIAKH